MYVKMECGDWNWKHYFPTMNMKGTWNKLKRPMFIAC